MERGETLTGKRWSIGQSVPINLESGIINLALLPGI